MKRFFGLLSVFLAIECGHAEFRFPERVQYLDGDVEAPPETFVGEPDDTKESSGAGVAWGGLGDGFILYDLLKGGTVEDPLLLGAEDPENLVQEGNGIINGPGPDLVLYEAIGGVEESHLIKVEVSNDRVSWTDLTASRQVGPHGLPALPSVGRSGEFASSYDLSAHGQVARYLRITGTANVPPGQSSEAGNGYDMDALAYAARPRMNWVENQHPGIGSSGFASIESCEGPVVACLLKSRTGVDVFSRSVGQGEAFRRLGRADFGEVVSAYQVRDGRGVIWLAAVSESGAGLSVQGYRPSGGTLPAEAFYSERTLLPAPENGAGYELAMTLGVDGLPIGVVTDGSSEARLFQVRSGGSLRVNVFGSVLDEPGRSSRHSGPSIALHAPDRVFVGVCNTRLSLDKRYGTTAYIMPVDVKSKTGLVEVPEAGAGENFILLQQVGDSPSQKVVDAAMAVSGQGKLAFVARDEVLGRVRVILQLEADPKSGFEALLPEGFKDGVDPSVVWNGEGSLLVSALIQRVGEDPYPVYAELDTDSMSWRVSAVAGLDLRTSKALLTLEDGGIPQLSYLSVSAPRAVIPEDDSDPDGNGLSVLEEEAGFGLGVEIELFEQRQIKSATVSTRLPGGGQVHQSRSYVTDLHEYDLLQSDGSEGFSVQQIPFVTAEGDESRMKVAFTSVLGLGEWGNRFFRIRVRRR